MEAVEDQVLISSYNDGVKEDIKVSGVNANEAGEICHKTNGVAESSEGVTQMYVTEAEMETSCNLAGAGDAVPENILDSTTLTIPPESCHNIQDTHLYPNVSDDNDKVLSLPSCDTVSPAQNECSIIDTELSSINTTNDLVETVAFETEVLVEKEETVSTVNIDEVQIYESYSENKMLSQLEGQNIELSEALRTPDITENIENNNFSGREEVFNKEELLDILEGNDLETSVNTGPKKQQSNIAMSHEKQKEIAINQLTKLKRVKKSNSQGHKKVTVKPKKEKNENKTIDKIAEKKNITETIALEKPEEENIIKTLVQDWEDDDIEDKTQEILNDSETVLNNSVDPLDQHKELTKDEKSSDIDCGDSLAQKDQLPNVNPEECHTQRRGRIIKKKVIFDPDNPDTFTKGKEKPVVKTKDLDKDQATPKKPKPEQPIARAASKSPVSKSPWKKPTPKNNKQYKRLTEVDKLLMDEGAVNMIYQLTPEAPKGRKNMRTKAEFIKKVQSSTPDGKEMKFRERKKEKLDESEAKKILVGKQRTSVSGSIASISISEDFDSSRPDDSIIYRRHSSSSYSSTCMSPRRLSDVESGALPSNSSHQQMATSEVSHSQGNISTGNGVQGKDVFMSDSTETGSIQPATVKKEMSLKEKLNSKLSTVLHKRKRETKTDKQVKQRKLSPKTLSDGDFKTLSITFTDRVAEIHINKTGLINGSCGVEVILELDQAVQYIDSKNETSVTLLTSETGHLCSSLDLTPLIDSNMEKRTNYAFEMSDAVRSLLISLAQHSKLLVCGVSSACEGPGLAVLVLCDLAVASERATFSVSSDRNAPVMPGIAVLNALHRALPLALVKELALLNRRLSASEALQCGLVSRTLWPDRFDEELRALAKDIAAQPAHSLLLKKQLLNLNRSPDTEAKFQASLSAEQDMIAAYWTSVEGQELLHKYCKTNTNSS